MIMCYSFLSDINKILEEHFKDNHFGITALCRELGISRVHLHRKIKKASGLSTSHFIRSFRLRKAKELLNKTELSVSEVARQVGFKSSTYFSTAYLVEFGYSPRETKERNFKK